VQPAPLGLNRSTSWWTVRVAADTADVKGGNLRVTASRMCHLVMLQQSGKHRLRMEAPKGYRLFVFTFG
jgi:hypothetical protein